jgi:glycosyltransferase involved in cell wall biosynthesis
MASKVLAVVPVYNGELPIVAKAVKSLLSQNYPYLKIVVIDDCSEEKLRLSLSKELSVFSQVTLMRNEKNIGFAQTLNSALNLVTDETYFMVLEQDCELLNANYVREAIEHFNSSNVGIVSGENLLPPVDELSLIKRVFVNHLCEDVHDESVVEVGFSLLKADVFKVDALKKVGGFESSARWKFASEEHLISYKIRSSGYKIIKDSHLRFRAYWSKQDTLLQNFKKEVAYGRGIGWALARMKSDLQVGESEQLRSKKLSRAIQAQYVLLTAFSFFLFWYNPLIAAIILASTALVQLLYLISRAFTLGSFKERLLFIAIGFISSWVYIPNFLAGFFYGLAAKYREKIWKLRAKIQVDY